MLRDVSGGDWRESALAKREERRYAQTFVDDVRSSGADMLRDVSSSDWRESTLAKSEERRYVQASMD